MPLGHVDHIKMMAADSSLPSLEGTDVPSGPRAVRGRGATGNPAGRFESTYLSRDPDGDGIDLPPDEERHVPTQYIETKAKSILSKVESPDLPMMWSLNPYQGCEHGCIYCYARPTHNYHGMSSGLDFERKILVKVNVVELLEKALQAPSWAASPISPISFSGNTDCYQPAEARYRLTRRLLEVCLRYGQPCSVITKNVLILRDAPILAELAREGLVHVYFSITSLEEPMRRILEPRTATAARRFAALEQLTALGVPCGVMTAPIIPSLNDHQIPALIEAAANSGALSVGYTVVRLNHDLGPQFEAWLQAHLPDRAERVLHQIRQLHEGSVSDSSFGRRMRGAGAWADMVSTLHRQTRNRLLAGRQMPPYRTDRFRPGGQMSLFGEG